LLLAFVLAGCAPEKPTVEPAAKPHDAPQPPQVQESVVPLDPVTGMVMRLSFDQDDTDASTSADVEMTNVETVDGKFGKGCRFSGDKSRIGLGGVTIPKEGSWCLWVRVSEDADTQEKIALLDGNAAGFGINNDQFHASFNDGRKNETVVGRAPVRKNDWIHLAMTWAGKERRFYVDGKLTANTDYSGAPRKSVLKMFVGCRWSGSGRHFRGDMDEIMFFNRALSADEIGRICKGCPVLPAPKATEPATPPPPGPYDVAGYGYYDKLITREAVAENPDLVRKHGTDGATALHVNAYRGNVDMAKFLLDNGANIEALDKWKRAPLHLAAEFGKLEVVKLLLSKGADVNGKGTPDATSQTPLSYAAWKGQLDVVRLLVEKGADVNAAMRSGSAPLHQTVSGTSNVQVAEFLIANGADLNAQGGSKRRTTLNNAARLGNKELVALLLSKGADATIPDSKGNTPLAAAQAGGHTEVVALLQKHGVIK